MKKLLSFCFFFSFVQIAFCQVLPVEWTRFIGQSTGCCVQLNYAIPTKDGGIVFTGSADASDTVNGDIPATTYGGVLVGKIDSNGNILWVRLYGGTRGIGICQTVDGGYGVIAYTRGVSGYVTGYHGNGDIWLLRIDSVGNLLWGNCYGSTIYGEEATSISETKDHGFILLGVSNGSGEDVPSHIGGSEFENDWFVVKTDSVGSKQWTRDIGGSNDEDSYGSIVVADTGFYLFGTSLSKDYDCIDTSWHTAVNTSYDYYILRLGDTGNVVWAKSFGGSGGERAGNAGSAIWDYRDSSIVVTGGTSSNDYMVSGNHGGSDIWTIKVDKKGNLIWQKALGGIYDDGGTSISILPGIGYLLLGGTNGVIGNSDNWIFILDTSGDVISNKVFGGIGTDNSASVFPFKKGFIATGSSLSTAFTEGINNGWRSLGQEMFISYLGFWPADVKQVAQIDETLQLYPNPSNGLVRILFPKNTLDQNSHLVITNTIGQTIYEIQINSNTTFIDLRTEEWAKGFYIVQWQGVEGKVLTTKLINN